MHFIIEIYLVFCILLILIFLRKESTKKNLLRYDFFNHYHNLSFINANMYCSEMSIETARTAAGISQFRRSTCVLLPHDQRREEHERGVLLEGFVEGCWRDRE